MISLQIWLEGMKSCQLYMFQLLTLFLLAQSEKDNNEFKAQLEELISKYEHLHEKLVDSHSHSCTCAQAKLRVRLVEVRILVEMFQIQILSENIYIIEPGLLSEIIWVVCQNMVPQMSCILKKYKQKYG